MADILVVADDLTGANATGAGFARAGLRAVTVGGLGSGVSGEDVLAEFHSRFDVVLMSTESRHATADEAAARVSSAIRAAWPVRLVCKRIDTTLRGNLGAEAASALRTVSELSGRRTVAVCAPAHPAAGRCTVQGHQLLHGRRLEETELARDARTPVRTSDVAATITHQAALRVELVALSTVTGPGEELVSALRAAVGRGAEVVVADALTEEHLDRIADAAATVAESEGIDWMGLDPGPGSLALARALGLISGHDDGAPLLAVSGSATELTRAQLARLVGERAVCVVEPVPRTTGDPPDVDATAAALAQAVATAGAGTVVLLATALREEDVVRLDDAAAARLPTVLGLVVRRVLEQHSVDGLFTTGGDVTAAVLHELGARGLEVEGEVVPLAVAGSLVGGPWDGVPVVTKGGLVGDGATTLACIDHLGAVAARRRRRVRAAGSRTPS